MSFLREYIYFHFSFKGRLNIKNFFMFHLEMIGFSVGLFSIVLLIDAEGSLGAINILVGVICTIASLSAQVQRLHDLNFSGWWVFLPFACVCIVSIVEELDQPPLTFVSDVIKVMVTAIAIIFCIFLYFVKGTKGRNRYGPDPLETYDINILRIPKTIVFFLIFSFLIILFLKVGIM